MGLGRGDIETDDHIDVHSEGVVDDPLALKTADAILDLMTLFHNDGSDVEEQRILITNAYVAGMQSQNADISPTVADTLKEQIEYLIRREVVSRR